MSINRINTKRTPLFLSSNDLECLPSKSPQHFSNSVFLFILLLLLLSDVLNVSGRINKPDNRKDMLDEDALAALAKGEPYFDKPPGWPPSGSVSSRGGYHNVSALIGKTAFLTCVVKNLGKSKSVSSKFLRTLWLFDFFLAIVKAMRSLCLEAIVLDMSEYMGATIWSGRDTD